METDDTVSHNRKVKGNKFTNAPSGSSKRKLYILSNSSSCLNITVLHIYTRTHKQKDVHLFRVGARSLN